MDWEDCKNSMVSTSSSDQDLKQIQSMEIKNMVDKAIVSASKHGISLVQGRRNPAAGDCSFESVIYNINDRDCFNEKLPFTVDYYRRIWVNDMLAKCLEDPTWNLGYTPEQLKAGFEELKFPGVYERGLFGDLLLPAISVGTHKQILIFNTNENSPHDPISVIFPESFGGHKDTEIPIILAYNLSHFESMHPGSNEDIQKSIDIINDYERFKLKLIK